MEIIDLKGLNTAEKSRHICEPHSVSAIKPAIKNDHRVNIFIDEKFAFSLDLAQVVDFKLKVGKTLTEPEIKKLKKASNFGKLYQRTLEWVLSRPRSIRETKDYLRKKQFDKKDYGITDEDIEKVLEILLEKKYLDDQKFTEYYIENRFTKKGISRKRLKLELAKKGISPETIDGALEASGRDETEEIKKVIVKKRTRYDDEKLLQYLVRQGFDYELSKSIIKSL
ncbi:MAG: RecX family transcriptional regulator [Candidatus Saccharibacteria bacterium]|nr:RecX family transcriptional regulator [Candidatus Saccharibacteria bacterium]